MNETEITDENGSEPLIKLEEAARRLNVSVKWLRTHRKKLPFVKELSPRFYRVNVEAMRRWEERRK